MENSSHFLLQSFQRCLRADDPRVIQLKNIRSTSSTFTKDADILSLGSTARRYIVITDGVAMRYRITRDGHRHVLMFLFKGDVCNSDFYYSTPMDHAVSAITKVRVEEIEQAIVVRLLATIPELHSAFGLFAEAQNVSMRNQLSNQAGLGSRHRLVMLLNELVRRVLLATGSQTPAFIPITQSLLAEAIGVTPIHLNRIMHELAEEGVVQTRRGGIVVTDNERLAAMCD